MKKYADIIIEISHEKVDKIFQYKIPEFLEDKLEIGMEVLIPFGKGNQKIKGYLVGTSDQANYDPDKIKEILSIVDNKVAIEKNMIQLAYWIKENYGATMIQALKTVLPSKQKVQTKQIHWVSSTLPNDEIEKLIGIFEQKNSKARARLLKALLEKQPQTDKELKEKFEISSAVLKTMKELGYIKIESVNDYRNPVHSDQMEQPRFQLNPEQSEIVTDILKEYNSGIRRTYLIQGVTGSGKTEVYMELIEAVLEEGKQAIVLIPEIALTYQMVMRFYQRFGKKVSIMNSRLSAGEKYDQMMRAKNNEISIMIGPRSALFTPFPNLGLIIMDEEHESSYKSETTPRYHARETAIFRGKMENASVVLGSATPSIESYYKGLKGEYKLYYMRNRVSERELPTVEIIDLCVELKEGNRSILSRRLQELIIDRLEKKEQIILFLNRRGYAGFVSCRSCGHVMKCPHCDVSLTIHNFYGREKLICHYCGHQEDNVKNCPSCKSPFIGGFKAGTQKIEELLNSLYPNARVLRMDADTTRTKEGHEKILSAFMKGQADILIGTQMIVKGHDFPKVTLVGIIAADLSLYVSDYRAGERTFQLLTQAAGRAGRGKEKGEVVIQTYQPEHYSVVTAAQQDYEGFYQQEISYRTLLGYPPVENMMVIMFSSLSKEENNRVADEIYEFILKIKTETSAVIGPVDPVVAKVNDIYKRVIYVKEKEYEKLVVMKDKMEDWIQKEKESLKVQIQFDFNPMNPF